MRATRQAVWLAAGTFVAGLGLLPRRRSVRPRRRRCLRRRARDRQGAHRAPGQPASVPVGLRKLMDTPLRDPSICLGPDGTYYLTGTSEPFWGFNNENGIRVWKSRDMVTWEPLGTVWRYGGSPWHEKYLEAKKPLWAPEIHYLKGTFWLTYSMPGWDGTAQDVRQRPAQEHQRQARRALRRHAAGRADGRRDRRLAVRGRRRRRSTSSGTAARSPA